MKNRRTDYPAFGNRHLAPMPTRARRAIARLVLGDLPKPAWSDDLDDRLDLVRHASVEEQHDVADAPLDKDAAIRDIFRRAEQPETLPQPHRFKTARYVLDRLARVIFIFTVTCMVSMSYSMLPDTTTGPGIWPH